MPAPTIVRGSDHFFNVKWIGNGRGQRVGTFLPFTDNGTIANSCIFNDDDTPKLTYSPSGSGDKQKFTFSCWYKLVNNGNRRIIFGIYHGSNQRYANIQINDDDKLQVLSGQYTTGSTTSRVLEFISTRTFEDTSKFYNIVVSVDTTQSTQSDRVKIYVDGDTLSEFDTATYPSQNSNMYFASEHNHYVSTYDGVYFPVEGYLAEVNFIDGTVYDASKFGLTDTSTGRWIPKTLSSITYGTNGFRLQFGSSGALGDDTSGNNNDFTVGNLSSTDQTIDSPTQNFANMHGRSGSGITLSEGQLKTTVTAVDTHIKSNIALPLTGKWYWEVRLVTLGGYERIGITPAYASTSYAPITEGIAFNRMGTDDGLMIQGVDQGTAWDGAFHAGDIVGFAVDMDNKIFYISDNGTYRNSANPANVTGGLSFAGTTLASNNAQLHPATGSGNSGSTNVSVFNFGQNPTFSGAITAGTETADSGPGLFKYDPPTGFLALCQDNFPETTKGKPDFVWIKDRSNSYNHELYDTTRGPLNRLTAESDVEDQINDGLQKFLKGGFSIEDRPGLNTNASKYISWNWLANGGTTSANTDGSGATAASVIQANQTAGFSIVKGGYFTGSLAHGLSQAPEWIMIKETDPNTNSWYVWHKSLSSEQYYLNLGASSAQADYGSNLWNVTSTKFAKNLSLSGTRNAIAYCWHGVEGYSKFGSYDANNSTNGPFVYTGFKPSWLLIKSRAAISWYIFDNERNQNNPVINAVNADVTNAEHNNQSVIDFLSNGFKIRNSNSGSGASVNSTSHDPYIYCAFAQHPFIGDGVNPCTAR